MRICCIGSALDSAAARLAAAGHAVVTHAGAGYPVFEAAEGADLVLTFLGGDAAVRRIYSELARTASPGQVFADHTAVPEATARWCGLVLPAFLAAPLGPDGLRVRGARSHFERARPAFEVYAGAVAYEGPLPG